MGGLYPKPPWEMFWPTALEPGSLGDSNGDRFGSTDVAPRRISRRLQLRGRTSCDTRFLLKPVEKPPLPS